MRRQLSTKTAKHTAVCKPKRRTTRKRALQTQPVTVFLHVQRASGDVEQYPLTKLASLMEANKLRAFISKLVRVNTHKLVTA